MAFTLGSSLKASIRRLGRSSLWQRVLLAFTLVAFGWQSYVTQTHIHFERSFAAGWTEFSGHGSKAFSAKADGSKHDKYPANEDPANCPICQEILYAGQYVAPTALWVLPPTSAVSTTTVADADLPFVSTISHDWRGRAPPASDTPKLR
jgi:hypothetical protein